MRSPLSRVTGILGISLAFASCTRTPAAEDLMQVYNKAIANMQEQKWGAAADVLQTSIDQVGIAGARDHGAAFGLFHYHLGLCRFQLGEFAKAKQAFETTYKDFADAPGAPKKNVYHVQSLYQWGRCEQELGNFKTAIELYMKFIDESPPKEREAARAAVRRADAAGEKAKKDAASDSVE